MKTCRLSLLLWALIAGTAQLTHAMTLGQLRQCTLSLLNARKTSLIQEAINSGYRSVDGLRFTYDLHGTKINMMMEAGTAHPLYADNSTEKGRGQLKLVARIRNPAEAMALYARVIDDYLQEPPVRRTATMRTIERRVVRKAEVSLEGGDSHGVELTIDSGHIQSGPWRGQEFHTLSSDTDIRGFLEPVSDSLIYPAESGLRRIALLAASETEYVFVIMPHLGRAESEKSERIFRSLLSHGNTAGLLGN